MTFRSIPPWLIGTLRVGVPVALLLFLWQLVDGPGVRARLAGLDWGWTAAALAAANLQIVICALRWRLVARQLGIPIGLGRAIGEYYLAQLVNQVLPGGLLGDAARAVRSRHEADLRRAAQAVVIERLSGQMALLAVLVAGFLYSIAGPGGVRWPDVEAEGAAIIAGVVVALIALVILLRFWQPPQLTGFGSAMKVGLFTRPVWRMQSILSLAVVACNLATFAFCARATGTRLPMEAVLTLIPLILTAMLIPASVGGWGFREGAAAALFPLAGASAGAGLAASVIFGLVILAASLPGILCMILPAPSRGSEALPDTPDATKVAGKEERPKLQRRDRRMT